jgi:hypothetical protein
MVGAVITRIGAVKREFHRKNKGIYLAVTLNPVDGGIYRVTTTSCDLMLTHPMDGDTFISAWTNP